MISYPGLATGDFRSALTISRAVCGSTPAAKLMPTKLSVTGVEALNPQVLSSQQVHPWFNGQGGTVLGFWVAIGTPLQDDKPNTKVRMAVPITEVAASQLDAELATNGAPHPIESRQDPVRVWLVD